MIIRLLYGVFFLYIVVRCILAKKYSGIKKSCNHLEIEIEKYWEPPEFINNQLVRPELSDNYDKLCNNRFSYTPRWRRLYFMDSRVKRYGGISIGILSLMLVWFNYQNNRVRTNMLIVILPPIVNLFNTLFEPYEVKLPWKMQSPRD
ncbi:hypothetical protein IW492_03105 [Enterococcus sp. BWB1-3]|uniref:hypothetical protein n=1 Tax=Enterococcus sp. BWB1-3 TaxID=2787713 RepID=UPI001923D259|nr:hypothetical protein [Enterococcus sp. BWB1-3]MBL1228221.1 hypothetical protein [Enterococcus sp. BWB1-3]